MLRKVVQIILAVTSVLFVGGLIYLYFFIDPRSFILPLVHREIDLRLVVAVFGFLMILNNIVLISLLQLDLLNRYSLRLSLDSAAQFGSDQEIPVRLHLKENVNIPVDEMLDVSFPIQQDTEVTVKDEVKVPVDVALKMPMDEEVDVEANVPIDTIIDLNTKFEAPILGNLVKIPINLKVPIKTTLPIQCKARVKKEDFVLKIKDTIPLGVKDPVPVHLNATFSSRFPFKQKLSVPLELDIQTNVKVDPEKPVHLKGDFILSKDSVKMAIVPGKKGKS